jgi:hypothetical protein
METMASATEVELERELEAVAGKRRAGKGRPSVTGPIGVLGG